MERKTGSAEGLGAAMTEGPGDRQLGHSLGEGGKRGWSAALPARTPAHMGQGDVARRRAHLWHKDISRAPQNTAEDSDSDRLNGQQASDPPADTVEGPREEGNTHIMASSV